MKRKILLLPLLFFITGCNVVTDITINKDLTVVEQINMTETVEFFNSHYKELPSTVIDSLLNSSNRKQMLINNGYEYEKTKLNSYPSILAQKSYSSLQDFSKNTIFKDQFYQNVTTTINESLVTFEAKDPVVYDEGNPDLYDVTKCSVTIKLPFKVIEHNADVYSLKNNTYTWNISNNNVKDIKLVFDKDKIHVYNFMMYISIVILILIILILIFIVIKLKNKNKTNNQFD